MRSLSFFLFAVVLFVFSACSGEKADPIFYIAENTLELESDCNQFEIEVTHNVEFTVTTDVNWITEIKEMETGKVSFSVERNVTNDFRTGKITFMCEEAGVRAVVDVKQNGRYEIVYTTKNGEKLDSHYYGSDFSVFFDAHIVSHTYKNGKGVFAFDGEITRIEELTFFYQKNITSVDLPNTIAYIGNYAFYATSIENIDIHNAVIGDHVFGFCSQLKKMDFPAVMDNVPAATFVECRSLQDIFLPEGIKVIGGLAFADCIEMKRIQLPSSVRKIGNGAFKRCYNLEEIGMPSYLESVGEAAFYDCSIKELVIPKGVKTIGYDTFYFCSQLQSLELPSTLTLINDNFFVCSALVVLKINATDPPVFTYGFGYPGVDLSKLKIYVPAASVEAYKTSESWAQYANNIYPME